MIALLDIGSLSEEVLAGKPYICVTGIHFDSKLYTLSALAKAWKEHFKYASVVEHGNR